MIDIINNFLNIDMPVKMRKHQLITFLDFVLLWAWNENFTLQERRWGAHITLIFTSNGVKNLLPHQIPAWALLPQSEEVESRFHLHLHLNSDSQEGRVLSPATRRWLQQNPWGCWVQLSPVGQAKRHSYCSHCRSQCGSRLLVVL